jgi:hypothetical protein
MRSERSEQFYRVDTQNAGYFFRGIDEPDESWQESDLAKIMPPE